MRKSITPLSRSNGRLPSGLHRRGAFTITEILMTLSLLVFVFAIGGQLFRSVVLLGAEIQRSSNQSASTDAALGQLRKDTWRATRIDVTGPGAVRLQTPDQAITWTIDADHHLTRVADPSRPLHWPVDGKDWSFAARPGVLLLRDGSSHEVAIASQLMLGKARHEP